jgi:hypothetical protein
MLSKDDAARDRFVELCSRFKVVLDGFKVVVDQGRAVGAIARQYAVIASEPCQSDDLRNEVKDDLNELTGRLNELTDDVNELMPLVSMGIAMLETPRRYLCEKFAKLADIQDSERHQFDEYAAEAMTRWFGAVFFHSKSGSADLILRAMKRSVTDV